MHEQLAFREEEVEEETRLELEVEKERHNVEIEEMANQVAELTKKGIVNGGGWWERCYYYRSERCEQEE